MRAAIALSIPALLAGCAVTSGSSRGPNGQPVYYIDGMSAAAAYRKADAKCPSGYNIIGDARQTTPFDYTMTIECKR